MKKWFLISICAILILFSCNQEPLDDGLHTYPGLPNATESGLNTMGCLINGVPWVANIEDPSFFWSLKNVEAFYGENRKGQNDYDRYYLDINCHKFEGKDATLTNGYRIREYVDIRLRPIRNFGNFDATKFDLLDIEYTKYNENEPNKLYILDSLAPIHININYLDTIHNIVSGLFDFRLKEIDDSKDTLRITNGRFDANYWPK